MDRKNRKLNVIQKIIDAETDDFIKLATLAGFDVSRDFSGADLSNTDLSNIDLSGVDFSYTILRNANLENANLQSANLSNTDFTNANLRGANLTDANLTEAILQDSVLDDVICKGVRPVEQLRVIERKLAASFPNLQRRLEKLFSRYVSLTVGFDNPELLLGDIKEFLSDISKYQALQSYDDNIRNAQTLVEKIDEFLPDVEYLAQKNLEKKGRVSKDNYSNIESGQLGLKSLQNLRFHVGPRQILLPERRYPDLIQYKYQYQMIAEIVSTAEAS